MARQLTNQDISWFLDLHEKNQLNLDPPYQRRSVWSPRDKRFFIDTILNNYPAPPVFLHKTLDDNGRPTYHVVDGKQRLQTIIEFTEGRIRIPDDFSDISLQKKRWKDLERQTKERFWNYTLVVEMLPDVSDAAIRNIFERINRNSRKLTAQELRHAKYDGWFITVVEREAEKQEWKDLGVVTTARAKRMADAQFISELFAVVLKKQILGFDQDALDEIYAEYEDSTDVPTLIEDEFFAEIERLKTLTGLLQSNVESASTALKVQAHFYSIWAYFVLELDGAALPEDLVSGFSRFLGDVLDAISKGETPVGNDTPEEAAYWKAVAQYAENSRGASTDTTPREKRHAALKAVLQELEISANENR